MDLVQLGFKALSIGMIATLVMDSWSIFQSKVLKIPSLNYALVGRWVLYIPKGMWEHKSILQSPPLAGEYLLGWLLHYVIGVLFAALYLGCFGAEPRLEFALLFGVVTLVMPFLILQPCLGFGIAASKTPLPSRARFMSLFTHLSFGLGIYLALNVVGM